MPSDADGRLGESHGPVDDTMAMSVVQRAHVPGGDFGRSVLLALVHSNAWISLGAASLAVSTMLLAGLPIDLLPACLVFGATMVVYGVNRFTDLAVDEQNVPGRAAFTRRYGVWLFTAGVALYLMAVGVAVANSVQHAVFLWLPPVVAVVYSLQSIQRAFIVKNVVVGTGWAAIPVGVGSYYDVLWTPEILVMAGGTAVLVSVAAMVFDVKDIEGDRAVGVRTVPTEYGPAWTRRIAIIVSLLVGIAVVGTVASGVVPLGFVALVALSGYVSIYSVFATPKRTPLFYGFIIDGEHLFLALVVLTIT